MSEQSTAAASTSSLESGIDLSAFDQATRPQDDFFRAINGAWLDEFEIPEDKAQFASFTKLHDEAQEQLRAIIDELGETVDPTTADPDSVSTKIATLYQDFLNTERIEELGIAPIAPLLAKVDEVTTEQLPALIGEFDRLGCRTPISIMIHQDNMDATVYLCDLRQTGLGLPDRDYYLDEKFGEVRVKYREHIARMWQLAGWGSEQEAEAAADRVLALETELAEVMWDKVRNRDPQATYNKMSIAEAEKVAPNFGIRTFLDNAAVSSDIETISLAQPDYVTALGELIANTDIQSWRDYLRWGVLCGFASYLSSDLDQAHFDFYGTTLSGVPAQRARWKRGVSLVEGALGEALGQLYVERHFPPENKERMVELVQHLIAAFELAIDELEWMTDETKAQAHAKLATFRPKIGYPDKWRDYSGLRFTPGDLVGNVIASNIFDHDREVGKLGGPIDRDEWFMPPQMVNAYYNPELNEIVFPAAILQPPFFTMSADDAVNYGGIGAVIGHEISHGFDDKGCQYDGEGNLRNWWTDADAEAFAERTNALSAQYAQYEPVPGHTLNGDLTLGENIADVSGLAVALRAYRHSLAGAEPPLIDGLTGEQRFFAGWAQVWRAKTREAEEIRRVASDPHSPPEYRVIGVLVNSDDFIAAFEVQPGDGMWRDEKDRVRIW